MQTVVFTLSIQLENMWYTVEADFQHEVGTTYLNPFLSSDNNNNLNVNTLQRILNYKS